MTAEENASRTAVGTAAATADTGTTHQGPRQSLQVLRVVAVLHSLAMIVQPVFAGMYLSGDVDALFAHQVNAGVVTAFDVIQLICAIVFSWKGGGRFWPIYTSLAIAVVVEVQVGVGFERVMAIHVPLGVSIIVAQILLTVWLFRADAATPRVRRWSGSEQLP
jgi:hypothetical protein